MSDKKDVFAEFEELGLSPREARRLRAQSAAFDAAIEKDMAAQARGGRAPSRHRRRHMVYHPDLKRWYSRQHAVAVGWIGGAMPAFYIGKGGRLIHSF